MKLAELIAAAARFDDFVRIEHICRIEENILEVVFSDQARMHHTYWLDMTRGQSTIYKPPSPAKPSQAFQAPFDVLLERIATRATLESAKVTDGDRILLLRFLPHSSYKEQTATLRLEFTGRHTNAILLDSNGVIIEALRHIGPSQSFRIIKPGITLAHLPSRTHSNQPSSILPKEHIDTRLSEAFDTFEARRLAALKRQKITHTKKKIAAIDTRLSQLDDEEKLRAKAAALRQDASIILAHLHRIQPYDRVLHANDFEGNRIVITLPKDIAINRMSEHLFHQAKKLERKAASLHIERDNLVSRRKFYHNTLAALEHATTTAQLDMLVPKRAHAKRKKEKQHIGELFWIEGYKVMVGRNSRENRLLLAAARANDIWMHTRNIPGSHVIIRTDKQNLPETLLQAAAQLCVHFSTPNPGNYEVDYTKRKFVKLNEGSHVVYDKYHTLHIRK